ncbi:MAG: ABC transporter ATP-binding protein [Gammaproteobacteria bacterium]|nr:ABC transporter ATP-binding protein [Gammaproteobacteria bacterium]MYC26110.1 ABC transporter ATP-binding protein [Gammaproteobacteria bacterium]
MAEASTQQSDRADSKYSAFDQHLTHRAVNVRMFARLLRWTKPYRLTLGASCVLLVIGALIAVAIPMLLGRVIVDEILAPQPGASQYVLPDFGLVGLTHWIANLLNSELLFAAILLYVAMVLSQSFANLAQSLTLTSGALKTLRDLRVDLFASLERKPSSFYDHVAVGRVMTRVTNDVENLYNLITSFIQIVADFVPFFIIIWVMFDMSVDLTLVALGIIPIAVVATVVFRLIITKFFRLIRDSVSSLNQYLQEDLMGIEVVQLSGRQEQNIAEYTTYNRENRKHEFSAINYEVMFESLNTSLPSIATALIIWYGGGAVVQGSISIGVLFTFTYFVNMLITPISGVGQFFNTLFRSMASGERIFQALDWEEQLHEPEHPAMLPERLLGEVQFRNVNFTYKKGNKVLDDVSFHIQPGEKLAIVGPTGSGKSTIIRLLARFYDIEDGTVFVDGFDVNSISSKDLRQRVGVVLQDFHIFSGTVYDNISLNNPDISKERVEWAARVVNADQYIHKLPEGYDTELAERGHNLSQGQQQLLAFARVLAANPEILVLDEATSSIDTGTELIIQDGLKKLTEGRTSIIIAHRLQTIQECDRILVLHRGKVCELGTHEELIAQKGIYFTLHELQFQDVDKADVFATPEDLKQRSDRSRWLHQDDADDLMGGL